MGNFKSQSLDQTNESLSMLHSMLQLRQNGSAKGWSQDGVSLTLEDLPINQTASQKRINRSCEVRSIHI